jgi:anti-sigma B factor antagonist
MPKIEPHDGQQVIHVREWPVGRVLVAELHGEVDFASGPAVAGRLDRLTARRRPLLVLDLRPVTFIDCAGLAVLCRARRRVRIRGGRLALVIHDPRVLRVLALVGLSKAFEVYGGLDEALAAHGAAVGGHPLTAPSRAVQPG